MFRERLNDPFQEDPTLERHFKGHRDSITSLAFNPNMRQLGERLAASIRRTKNTAIRSSVRRNGLLPIRLQFQASISLVPLRRTQGKKRARERRFSRAFRRTPSCPSPSRRTAISSLRRRETKQFVFGFLACM